MKIIFSLSHANIYVKFVKKSNSFTFSLWTTEKSNKINENTRSNTFNNEMSENAERAFLSFNSEFCKTNSQSVETLFPMHRWRMRIICFTSETFRWKNDFSFNKISMNQLFNVCYTGNTSLLWNCRGISRFFI